MKPPSGLILWAYENCLPEALKYKKLIILFFSRQDTKGKN
jgi:hypothetical protein